MEKMTYSVPEVANILGIGRNLAYQLVQKGDIPSIRLGEKRLVVPRNVVNELLGTQL